MIKALKKLTKEASIEDYEKVINWYKVLYPKGDFFAVPYRDSFYLMVEVKEREKNKDERSVTKDDWANKRLER